MRLRQHRHEQSRLQPGDIVRIDGKLATVVAVHFPDGLAELEPLADRLAWTLAVSDQGEPIRMWDALLEAGWTAPE